MPEPYELSRKSINPTAMATQAPIEIGMMGFSLEDVVKGQKGYVQLPLGARDSTKWGGRRWVRVKLTAMENVRANRDIIIGNEQAEFKEHTPVELSFDKHTGGYQRAGEDYPLPATLASKGYLTISKTLTAAGFTELVVPTANKKLRIHWYSMSNAHSADTGTGLSFDDNTATLKHRYYLAAQGGTVTVNLVDAAMDGEADECLYGYLTVACADGVYFNITYSEEDE